MRLILIIISFILINTSIYAKEQYGIAMHGEPKYGPNDTLEYVNPNAPIGGEIRIGQVGSWDGFNPFITKDTAPAGLNSMSEGVVFEELMFRSGDEPFSVYGLLAKTVEMADDRSWIIFNINPDARWADGKPVTAKDVIFSHTTLKEKGRPNLRLFYSKVEKTEELGPLKVIFHFKKTPEGDFDPELPLMIGLMPIIPKHVFEGKDFERMTKEPFIGSGPYKVKDYKIGKSITYERRPDYWGWKLQILRGQFNFQKIRYEYFGNEQVEFEAFKAGETMVRTEPDPKKWFKAYDFNGVKEGKVIRAEIPNTLPVGMTSLVFNSRREQFKDLRVRRAISHMFDFQWINKNLLHGKAKRTMTYFDNCELTPQGLPSGKELEILTKFKDQLPAHVFTTPFVPPSEQFNGDTRANLREAIRLMKEAGWTIKNNKMVNAKGEQFKFEIVLHADSQKKVAINFANILRKKLGLLVEIRTVDVAQLQKRMMTFDYDTVFHYIWHSLSPGREQSYYWSTRAADEEGSRNYPGIRNPVIDQVCNILATAKDRNTLIGAAKALGRLLNWEEKVLPLYHKNVNYIAYWNNLDHPKFRSDVLLYMNTWWSKNAGK